MKNAHRVSDVLLLPVLAVTVTLAASDDLIWSARTNRNTIVNGKLVSVLQGDVKFVLDSVTLKCDQAQWMRDDGRIRATGHVDVAKGAQRITCDRVDYTRDDKTVLGSGNVVFVDRNEGVKVTGNTCRYSRQTGKCLLEGSPRVFRFDTASVETLTIVSKRMSYDDSLKRTTASGSVRITKGLLLSESDTAHYFTEREIAQLRKDPRIRYDIHRLTGDSVDLTFHNDTLEGVSVEGSTHGVYFEQGRKDTTRTQVWGDSLYMALTDSGSLDSVRIFRDVKSSYSPVSDTSEQNTVNGRKMVLAFGGPRGEVRQAEVTGNATSTYFLEDKQGRNEASGDTLTVWFNEGRAQRLRLTGGVRGTYYPPQTRAVASDSAKAEKKKP